MDVVLEWADEHLLDKAWNSINPDLARDNLLRQCVSVSCRHASFYSCIHCNCLLEMCLCFVPWTRLYSRDLFHSVSSSLFYVSLASAGRPVLLAAMHANTNSLITRRYTRLGR